MRLNLIPSNLLRADPVAQLRGGVDGRLGRRDSDDCGALGWEAWSGFSRSRTFRCQLLNDNSFAFFVEGHKLILQQA
jgi:hypothetical protein